MTVGRRARESAVLAERRHKVSAMVLRHVTQEEIAVHLGVDQATISRDVTALRSEWQAAAATDIAEWSARELAELDQMERDVALEFNKSRDVDWLRVRLDIKKRRAAQLGLDAPKRTELSGAGGGPLELAMHPDWVAVRAVIFEELEDDPARRERLARRFLELRAV